MEIILQSSVEEPEPELGAERQAFLEELEPFRRIIGSRSRSQSR